MSKKSTYDMPFAAFQSDLHFELFSDKEAVVEGTKGIIEYNDSYVKLGLKNGVLEFFGDKLEITALNIGEVIIKGKITKIEFGNWGAGS